MYNRYCELRDRLGVNDAAVSKATGINRSTFSDWKSGRSTPKRDKLQKIADYFHVSIDYLMTGEHESGYYTNPEAAKIAQQVYDDPDLRLLFEAARDVKPENVRLAAELLRRFKETND